MTDLHALFYLHVFIDSLPFLYISFFPKKYDIFIVAIISLQCVHWIALKNECSITYLEKQKLDPNYVLGSDIKNIPHEKYWYKYRPIIILLHFLQICVFLFILYRNRENSLIIGLSIFNLTYIIYFMRLRYF
jgi:hypothetical protein